MSSANRGRYFDMSTIIALAVITLLLVSLPGGCGGENDDSEDIETEEVAEPTSPPMMEIVEPEPGVIGASDEDQADADNGAGTEDEPADQEGEPGEASEDEAGSGEYVVQAGDTLYAIAVRFGVSIDALLEANGISDPNSLQVGQVLRIPDQD